MKKSPEAQRKLPKQERAKAIVEAILEATVRILPKVGSQNVTTKKIADFVGVSIGSLYQYFPNKESVLGGIVDMAANSKLKEVQKRGAKPEIQAANIEHIKSLVLKKSSS